MLGGGGQALRLLIVRQRCMLSQHGPPRMVVNSRNERRTALMCARQHLNSERIRRMHMVIRMSDEENSTVSKERNKIKFTFKGQGICVN